jgi:hypothetical protein
VRGRRTGLGLWALGFGLVMLLGARAAWAGEDYDPHSQDWNGMSRFVGLCEGTGYSVDPVTELDWDKLTANDILFLVYPFNHVDPAAVGKFVQAGGNVVIADDFGESKDALAALGLVRAEMIAPKVDRYWKDLQYAPIADVRGDHVLAHDVTEIVTNHPAAFTHIEGASQVIGFDDAAVVVAGQKGTGRFVAVSDPSIFINRMQEFPGNVVLTSNILSWLDRHEWGARARRVVLLRGEVRMFGTPRTYIDDPNSTPTDRQINRFNSWLATNSEWVLTPTAMKVVGGTLAVLLLVLAIAALPVRRGPRIDGAWLRFGRPVRRDEPQALVASAERGGGSLLVLACILRDQVQTLLHGAIQRPEALYTIPEAELVAQVSAAKGTVAGVALTRVYRRLRALPSRSQAAAPWSAGSMNRRDFDALYRDVAELCRTLGSDLEAT